MDDGMFWAVAMVAAVLVGMAKGGLPVVGMLGVPVLSLVVSPVTAAGLLLPVLVVSDAFGLYAYRHAFDGRVLVIMGSGATIGVGLGWATASVVQEWMVTLMVGLIGFVFALNLLVRKFAVVEPRQAEPAPGIFWGIIAGFTSFVSHTGGPPFQVYALRLGMSKTVFAGTSTILFAYINAIKLVPYWALGQFSATNLKVAAVMMPAAAGAVFGGVWLVKLLPERLFFQIITWTLLAVSLKLIVDGLRG